MDKLSDTLPTLGSVLKISGAVIPILAITAYFSGWQYVNQYFSEFGINKSSFSFNDYTVFTYLFSVVTKIPQMIRTFNIEFIKSVFLVLLIFICPLLIERTFRPELRKLSLTVCTWSLLILSLFFISQEAGTIDANKVFKREARPVDVYFTESLKNQLKFNKDENWASERIAGLRNASDLGAIGLIWRNKEETILLIFGTDGDLHGEPLEILRLSNKYIVSIFTKYKP
jgi:hypothetical protein